jgi:hypothetical protein
VVCAAAKFDRSSSVTSIAATTALLRKPDSLTTAIAAVPARKGFVADQAAAGDALRSLLRQQQRAKRLSIVLFTRAMSAVRICDRPNARLPFAVVYAPR